MQAQRYRLPSWAVAEGPFGIRLLDVAIVLLVILAIEINVTVGNGPGAVPLTLSAHLLGAALALPILFRHRWPFQVMIATAVLIALSFWRTRSGFFRYAFATNTALMAVGMVLVGYQVTGYFVAA